MPEKLPRQDVIAFTSLHGIINLFARLKSADVMTLYVLRSDNIFVKHGMDGLSASNFPA